MKITFLGTSHGYAEKNRFTSSTLIETEQYSYILDAGAPVEWILENMDKPFDKIRGVFITHMHPDHAGSLSSVIVPLLRYRFNDNVTCFLPSREAKEGFLNWLVTLHENREAVERVVAFDVAQKGKFFENGDISVTAKPNMHMDGQIATYSYTFASGGKRVLFTGDLAPGFPEYAGLVGETHYDLVVCEMAHVNLFEVADLLKKTNTERMIFTHYHDYRLEGKEKILPSFPFRVEIATDGMEVEI